MLPVGNVAGQRGNIERDNGHLLEKKGGEGVIVFFIFQRNKPKVVTQQTISGSPRFALP